MDKIKILGGNMKKFELSFCTYFKRIEQFKYAHETYDECVAFFVKSGSFAYKIEGESEQAIYDCLDKLGISKDKIVTLDVSSIYTHYGYDGDALTNLNFEMEEK